MNTEETTNLAKIIMKHPEAYLYEKYDAAYKNTKPGQAYPDYWPSYVVEAFKAYAKDIEALGGRSIQSAAPSKASPEGIDPQGNAQIKPVKSYPQCHERPPILP